MFLADDSNGQNDSYFDSRSFLRPGSQSQVSGGESAYGIFSFPHEVLLVFERLWSYFMNRSNDVLESLL